MDKRKPRAPVKEVWTPEMIAKARKICLRHGSIAEAMEAMGSKLTVGSARERFVKLGMRFTPAQGSIHAGNAKILQRSDR